MTPLRVLLCVIVFWVVEQIHLPASFGIKGLNSMNVLVLVAFFLVLRQSKTLPLQRDPTPLKVPILFFFFMLTYALIVGLLKDASFMAADFTLYKTGVFYISLYFLAYHGARDAQTVRILVLMIMAVAALAGVEAMREAMDYGLAAYSDTKRAAGPFGEDYSASNLAAVFFTIFMPLFIAVSLHLRDRPLIRFAAMGGVALLVFAIFFTYSRQAYAIVAITALLMAMRKNLGVALLLSLALWNYELWVPTTAIERVQSTTQSSSSEYGQTELKVDESTASRFELWEGGARMLQDQPTGVGLNHWKRQISNYSAYDHLDAHNFYVLITAEAGPLGAVAVIWLVMALFAMAIKQMNQAVTPEAKTLAYGFMGATLALAMGNMYGSRFLNGEVIGNYWIFAGLCARYWQLARDGALDADGTDAPAIIDENAGKARRLPNGQLVRPAKPLEAGASEASAAALADAEAGDAGGEPAKAATGSLAAPQPGTRDQYGRLIKP